MTLCLSTGSVWRAAGSRIECVHLAEENFSGLIDGVELCFMGLEEFEKFELDKRGIRFLRGLKFNSLHAPIMEYGKNAETKKAFGKMREIAQDVEIKHITFHPNHIRDFSVLKTLGLKACIENLRDGENHRGWQFPKEIKVFLEREKDIGFCLDVTHAMANGINPKEFLDVLGEKISGIHLNATEKAGTHEHNFVFSSSRGVQEKIGPVFALKKPLIIEVAIEKEKIPLIKEEIAFARKKMS